MVSGNFFSKPFNLRTSFGIGKPRDHAKNDTKESVAAKLNKDVSEFEALWYDARLFTLNLDEWFPSSFYSGWALCLYFMGQQHQHCPATLLEAICRGSPKCVYAYNAKGDLGAKKHGKCRKCGKVGRIKCVASHSIWLTHRLMLNYSKHVLASIRTKLWKKILSTLNASIKCISLKAQVLHTILLKYFLIPWFSFSKQLLIYMTMIWNKCIFRSLKPPCCPLCTSWVFCLIFP